MEQKIAIRRSKKDNENKIQVSQHYVALLKNLISECSKELSAQKKPTGYRKAKLEIEVHETTMKLHLQVTELNSKLYHFHNVFVPQFNADMAEYETNHESVIGKAKLQSSAQISFIVSEYEKLADNDKEGKMFLYFELKKLVGE